MTFSEEQQQGLKNIEYLLKEANSLASVKGCKITKDIIADGNKIFITVRIYYDDECLYSIENKELKNASIGTYTIETLLYYMADMPFVTVPKRTYIYGLFDPKEPDEYRYIGKSDSPESRLSQHIRGAKKMFVDKDKWIKLLLDNGEKPHVRIIEEVMYTHEVVWGLREEYHITNFKNKGHRITNMASGGASYKGKGYNRYDELLDIWRKDPTIDAEINLKREQRIILESRIKRQDSSALICDYCGAYIPSLVPDSFAHWRCVFDDILPFKPLLEQHELWGKEQKKHDSNCIWWKTGMIGLFSPIQTDTFLELRDLVERKIKKYEAFHYFDQTRKLFPKG